MTDLPFELPSSPSDTTVCGDARLATFVDSQRRPPRVGIWPKSAEDSLQLGACSRSGDRIANSSVTEFVAGGWGNRPLVGPEFHHACQTTVSGTWNS